MQTRAKQIADSSWKSVVDAATTAALANTPTYANGTAGSGATLTRTGNGAFPSIDGVTAALGKRYLVKNQAASEQNGIYVLTTLGDGSTPWVLTRAGDFDQSFKIPPSCHVPVKPAGVVNGNQHWQLTAVGADPLVIGNASTGTMAFSREVAADAAPTSSDKAVASAATAGNGQTTAVAITNTPTGDGYVRVNVNGVGVTLGDAVTTKDCYFSVDAGSTARAIAAITAADVLYWNGVVAGYDLDATDLIDLLYDV